MPGDLHSSLLTRKKREHISVSPLRQPFFNPLSCLDSCFIMIQTQSDFGKMWYILKKLYQCVFRHPAECHIAMPHPILLIHGNKGQHINRSFKNIHRIAFPNPVKTVSWIAAFHISLKRFPPLTGSSLMGMAWNSIYIKPHKNCIVVFSVFINICLLANTDTTLDPDSVSLPGMQKPGASSDWPLGV